MKKAWIIFLLIACILTGCNRTPVAELKPSDASEAVTEAPETAKQDITQPQETQELPTEAEITEGTEGQETTAPEVTEPTEPTAPTEPSKPTEPEPTATKPVVTEPPITEPTKPTVTEPPETEPPTTQAPTEAPKPQIDMEAIEKSVERYAETIGYVYDPSLQPGNCGYYPPEYWPLTSNEEGVQVGIGLLIATTHQLNSRYETEYGDELIEKFFGYVRVNCEVVFDESNELGDWYIIYIYYG